MAGLRVSNANSGRSRDRVRDGTQVQYVRLRDGACLDGNVRRHQCVGEEGKRKRKSLICQIDSSDLPVKVMSEPL